MGLCTEDEKLHRDTPVRPGGQLCEKGCLFALFGCKLEAMHTPQTTIVLIPAFNEQAHIAAVVAAVRQFLPVLVVDDGSRDQTALLAELSNEIYTMDRLSDLAQTAQKRLELLGYHSIHYKTGDGTMGWEEFAPYDRIIVSAGSPQIPNKLIEQLSADNGILLCPVGNELSQDLIRVIKRYGHVEQDNLGSCVFVKLVGAEGWKE